MRKMTGLSGLRLRLFVLLLLAALVPLTIAGIITMLEMNQAAQVAEEKIGNLSVVASEEMASGFGVSSRNVFVEFATAKAGQYDELFARIETENEILAKYTAENFFDSGGSTINGVWIAPYGPDSASLEQKRETVASLTNPAKLLRNIVQKEEEASLGYIGTSDGVLISWPDIDEVLRQIAPFDHRERPWYITAESEKKTIWTKPYTDASTKLPTITCATPIYRNEVLVGVTGMDISLASMYTDLSRIDEGYPFIVDKEGTVVMHGQGSSPWDELFAAGSFVDIEDPELNLTINDMKSGKSGSSVVSFNDEDFNIVYVPMNTIAWSLGIIIPADEIYSSLGYMEIEAAHEASQNLSDAAERMGAILLVLFLITGLLVGAAGLRIGREITYPIVSLKEAARKIGRGNFDVKLEATAPDEIGALERAFARMASDIEQHMTKLEMDAEDAGRVQRETEIVREIKAGLHSKQIPLIDGYEIAARTIPIDIGGGDFLDIRTMEDKRIAMLLADVSGKGIPAALLSVLSRTIIRASSRIFPEPAKALSEANVHITEGAGYGMVTCFYGMLDPFDNTIEYVNAGHIPPFLVSSEGVVDTLAGGGMALGTLDQIKLQSEKRKMEHGDLLVLYSDGITEALNDEGEQFGTERLIAIARDNIILSASEILDAIEYEIRLHTRDLQPLDNSSLLILKRRR